MTAIELIEIDDSIGLILPESLISKYGLKEGDEISLVEAENGFLLILQNNEENEQ